MVRAERLLRLTLAALLLAGQPAAARELPAVQFTPVEFRLTDEDPCRPGLNTVQSNGGLLQPERSPAPSVVPVHNNFNPAPSVWGTGWHEATDATLRVQADGSVTWVDGTGAQRTFVAELGSDIDLSDPALLEFALHGTTATPAPAMRYRGSATYQSPINTYERLVFSTGAAANLPTELRLEAVNGDVTAFNAFESSAVLRPALLTDRNGNTLAYARDPVGRLIRVTDVYGRFTHVAYNPAGFVQTLTDHAGRVVTFSYDAQGRKTSEAGLEGPTAYLYEGATARIARITYPNGSFRRYEYDAAGRVTLEASDNEADKLTYVYESTRTLVTDGFGKTTVRELRKLSGALRPFRVTDPRGGVTLLAYDNNLNLTRHEDPRSNVTTYAYDAFGNVTDVTTLADNGSTVTQYNGPFHQPSLLTDPRTVQTAFGYNPVKGDLTSVTTPDGATTMQYDPFGHVLKSFLPGIAPPTEFHYDALGALDLVTDPLGRPTSLTRDALGRVTRNVDPKGKVTDFLYDAAGNLEKVTERLGAQALETSYGYAAGRTSRLLRTVTDAKGQVTTFGYDALGRLTDVTDAAGALTGKKKTFTYDLKSRLATSLDPNGNLIAFGYDELDRLLLKDRPDGDVTYGYDANGNLTSVVKAPDSSISMTYDGRDRLETVRQTVGGIEYLLTYGYDMNGNRTSMATPWGAFLYTYDGMNRLDLVTVPASLGAPARTFDFDYDAAGRRSKLSYPNGTEAVYSYDAASQLLEIRHKLQNSTHTLALSAYTYDAAGNRTTMTDLNGTHFYGYDELHRATAAVHPPASGLPIKHEVFEYDAVGNRLADARAAGYAYDSANRLLSDSLYTYCNDNNGNRICRQSRTVPADRTDYGYDSENQLVGVTNATGTFTYKYDGLGRRIEKSSGVATGQTVRYVYDNEDILAMVDGGNNVLAVLGQGPAIREPLTIRRSGGTEFFMHSDALGSIVEHTTLPGASVERIEYEAYGLSVLLDSNGMALPALTQSLTGGHSRYGAGQLDFESGLHHFGKRYFDSRAGRFTSPDPMGLRGNDINLFAYVQNQPINWTDPFGTAMLPGLVVLPSTIHLPPSIQPVPMETPLTPSRDQGDALATNACKKQKKSIETCDLLYADSKLNCHYVCRKTGVTETRPFGSKAKDGSVICPKQILRNIPGEE